MHRVGVPCFLPRRRALLPHRALPHVVKAGRSGLKKSPFFKFIFLEKNYPKNSSVKGFLPWTPSAKRSGIVALAIETLLKAQPTTQLFKERNTSLKEIPAPQGGLYLLNFFPKTYATP